MAEFRSHHATAGKIKPTIFEVIGHENLASSLRAAFRHLFKFLAEMNPEKLSFLHRYFELGFTLGDSFFQYIHLRLKGGLFTETFYGLKRIPDPRSKEVSKLKVVSWVVLAIVFPYLRTELENLFKLLKIKKDEGSLTVKGIKHSMILLYIKFYPLFHFIWETTLLIYYMAYALGRSNFHSPLLHLASVQLTTQSVIDLDENIWVESNLNQKRNISVFIWNLLNSFIGGVTLTISIGAFFIEFLQWWYSQEEKSSNLTSMPIVPPPGKLPLDVPIYLCPLCGKERTNDTALSSSGFVFCYPCIFQYVKAHEKCPITGYRSSLDQLIKLYHQD